MERKEWLKSLKEGDLVADKRYNGHYSVFKIKKITPKGYIRLETGHLLKENGEYYKFEDWFSTRIYIEPLTEEIKNSIAIRKETISLINTIKNTDFKELNIDKLRKMVQIIKE